uniref:Uncharacterized protein n=1 Tax=Kalanchoe fedtschenkoi TaxID=63787 RepID=A0A7N0U1P3_KALFE
MRKMSTFVSYSLLLLLLATPFVASECTCDASDPGAVTQNKSLALKLKLIGLFAILFLSAAGVCLPLLGRRFERLQADKGIFFLIKAFAGGVILATGFVHVLVDAFDDLTSPCLDENPWGRFPFTGFIAMVAAITTLAIDSFALSYYENLYSEKQQPQPVADQENNIMAVHTHTSHVHPCGGSASSAQFELLKHKVVSQVLELGIVVHSVIIGISFGASQNPDTINPLIAALSFHQFFEGMGLGGCIFQANFDKCGTVIMILFFALTTPLGIVIGLIVSNTYDESSPRALMIQGVLNASSAGILIYMSLVDVLAPAFANPAVKKNLRLQSGGYVALLLGAGCMALMAKWA